MIQYQTGDIIMYKHTHNQVWVYRILEYLAENDYLIEYVITKGIQYHPFTVWKGPYGHRFANFEGDKYTLIYRGEEKIHIKF